jgi:S-adenosylmethionine decarboxylase
MNDKNNIFEPAEKKVYIHSKNFNFLTLKFNFWEQLLKSSNAFILSFTENISLKAFVLSESSLFVWKHKILLVTCGQTNLINSVLFLIEQIGKKNIDNIIFSRQSSTSLIKENSTFNQDVKVLTSFFDGNVEVFHNNFQNTYHTFSLNNQDTLSSQREKLVEVYAYNINKKHLHIFNSLDTSISLIREILQIKKFIPSFIIDDYLFEPPGYSMNAIYNEKFITIHVTPQSDKSFFSLETNISFNLIADFIKHILKVLTPNNFDLFCNIDSGKTTFSNFKQVSSKNKISQNSYSKLYSYIYSDSSTQNQKHSQVKINQNLSF